MNKIIPFICVSLLLLLFAAAIKTGNEKPTSKPRVLADDHFTLVVYKDHEYLSSVHSFVHNPDCPCLKGASAND